MNDFEFELTDRVQKIRSIDTQFDLRNNSFISFSGGKDSLTVSRLIDESLPDNLIPLNFQRTGCKGCPYSLDLQKQLETMALFFPAERKQCEVLWRKVYTEYRRIGYRLTGQPTLFD